MPQISTIHYKDIQEAQRFDAEYFKPEYLDIQIRLEKFGSIRLGDVLGYGNVFSGPFGSALKSESYQSSGVPFIRISDIHDIFIEKNKLMYISEEESERLSSTTLGVDDIVLSKIGTIGRLSLITEELGKVNISENNVGLRLKSLETKQKRLLLFFLLSRYGQSQIVRFGSGNVQLKFNIKDIDNLLLPKFQAFDLDYYEKAYGEIISKQAQSKKLYQEAEELLLQELRLIGHEVRHRLAFSTTKRGVDEAGRIDAEYFQPKYQEIIDKIEAYPGGWASVKDCIHFNDQNYFPNLPPRAEKLHKYIALSNVSSLGYIQDYQEELGQDLPSRARRRVHAGEVIISSIEGSLSSCALVEEEFDGAICSTGFFVLKSDRLNSETLLLLFKSNIIQELLARGSKGTILTAISKSELETIKLPLIKKEIQEQIAEKIIESHRLRKESKELLERAKLMVEREIEREEK